MTIWSQEKNVSQGNRENENLKILATMKRL